MLIVWVITTDVDDCAIGAEAGEGVYMAVRIISRQVSVVEPQDALSMEVAQ